MKKNSMWKMAMSLMIVLAAIFFTGCADKEDEDDKKEQTYYLEYAQITRTDFNTLVENYGNQSYDTFAQKKQARALLRSVKYYDFASGSGYKKERIHNVLTQKGFTKAEANELFESINTIGNALFFGNSAYSDDLIAWVYIEKE